MSDVLLGTGGFGKVYDTHWQGKRVALKISESSPQARREAEILCSGWHHPNVATGLFWQEINHELHLYMQYGGSSTLFEYATGKDCTHTKTFNYVLQCIDAVSFLHRHGMYHRDLKLENITLDKDHIKIVDFGLCTLNRFSSSRVGSRSYSAPEVFLSEEYDSALLDAWSLGVMTWAMLFNNFPFYSCTRECGRFRRYESACKLQPDLMPMEYFSQHHKASLNAPAWGIMLLNMSLVFDPSMRTPVLAWIPHGLRYCSPFFHSAPKEASPSYVSVA